jgi:dTDP-4-amino-4,6-dideoxygalactose transaminase
MRVPLIQADLPALAEIREQLEEVFSNGRITNFGKYNQELEREAGAYLGTNTATISSGTMGLLFTLSALGLKAGQKVILPSFTFMATAQAVVYAGGVPLFAEIEDDMNLSPADLERLLGEHPDVGTVIAVHMYGLPARASEIQEVVDHASTRAGRKIPLMFDAAHAFGASIAGTPVGGFGDAEVFSLSVTKALVAVEGGLVSSRNPELIERIRSMRNYGILSNYNTHFPGMNGKMSELHAIVGLYNLRRLHILMDERRNKACMYKQAINSRTPFRVLPWPADVTHTFKDFTINMPEGHGVETRDKVMRFLAEREIETRAYFFPPVHEQAYFSRFADRQLPKTEMLSRRVITLPFFTSISPEQVEWVVSSLESARKELS